MNPLTVYLILEFSSSLLFSLIFTVNMLYQVTVVELSPFQLVLIGTILEASVFVFEVPTGVLADIKSRRLSIIVGYVVMGLGFIVEGSLPFFWSVALAQVVWGLGYTFTSGATQAWIADEVGEKRTGEAFLRGTQAARIGALTAVPISVVLGTVSVQVPIVLAGVLMNLLALFLAMAMTEAAFTPTPPEDRTTWGAMLKTVRDAHQLVRRQPELLVLLGIGFFYGLYSEGFDRLWTPHLLGSFDPPLFDVAKPVVWFGVIRAVGMLIDLLTTEGIRRRVDTQRSTPIARALMAGAGVIILGLAGFGLAHSFWLALALYWLIGAVRSMTYPLQATWLNLRIEDPQVRATLFSVSGQVDAIGQIAGGPGVGAIGNRSIRAALVTSAVLLSPVLPLYAWVARRRGDTQAGD